jgi:F-type H+-transporting ATPase subunit b
VDINWTTFILEIINFLVLVWLLKHFFYRPVKAVITRRQQDVEKQLAQAEETRTEADALRKRYENRVTEWEDERDQVRQELRREIEAERQRMRSALNQEVEAERKRAEVLAERQLNEQQRQAEARALELGAQFASHLLRAAVSPELQKRLFDHLLEELQQLPPTQRDELHAALENSQPDKVHVLSAFPLDKTQQKQLRERVDLWTPHPLHFEFQADQSLIAGVRVSIGPWVLHANLNDELKTFAAIAYER